MSSAVVLAVAAAVLLSVTLELVTVVVPLVLVITLVEPQDRQALANVLAAADRTRRPRLWPELGRALADRHRRQTNNNR